ncbi:hypothetical protein [Agrobacterium burrii]|uniref:Uncharacterized protein n=1 Tax=Agrobacterium burrii TaxID=2815339 RepID=A0ABS3EK63_9HYPH|nr:hypothetical protein [Agrobacterium burrii]MBO0132303.1 hypothetical protein [Agrobacterium burrii]
MGSTTEQLKGAIIGAFATVLVTTTFFFFQEQIKAYWEENIEVSYEYTELVVPTPIVESLPSSAEADALEGLFKRLKTVGDAEFKYDYELNNYYERIKSLKLFYLENGGFDKSFTSKNIFSAYNIEIKNTTEKTVSSLKFPIPTGYNLGSSRKNIDISAESATIKDILPNEKINIYLFSIGNQLSIYSNEITFTANDKKLSSKNRSSDTYRPTEYPSFIEFTLPIFTIFTIFMTVGFIGTIVIDANTGLRRKTQNRTIIDRMKSDLLYHSEKGEIDLPSNPSNDKP